MREASLSPTKARRGGGGRKKQVSVDAQSMAVQQKVPLRDVEQEGGSPLKQPPRRRRRATPAKVRPEETVGEEIEVRRPARKRKGTPIRRHGAREKMARQDDEDDEEQEGEEDLFGTTTPPSADLHRSRRQRSQILPSQAVAAPPSHHSPQHLQVPSSSSRPTSRTSAKSKDKRRSSLQPYHFRDKDGTLRTARLSQAREELDTALQDALGYSDEIFSPSADHHYQHSHHSEAERRDDDDDDEADPDPQPDENTVSINEDFTMVSVETLQSMKTGGGAGEGETSLVSHHRHSQSVHPGEKSGLSVSYLPSSPPKEDFPATGGDEDGDVGGGEGQGTEMEGAVLVGEMDGYTSTATREQGREEGGEEVSESDRAADDEAPEEVGGYDVMSWKPTGPAKRVDSHNHLIHQVETEPKYGGIEYSLSEVESGEDDGEAYPVQHEEGADDMEEEKEEEGEDSPAQLGAQQSPPQGRSPSTNNNDNNEDIQADEDDDIWYEEASRSLEQDAEAEGEGNESFSQPSSRRQYNPHRSGPSEENNEARRDTGPNNMQDLFANQPNKPPRAKIPRTWRRSSGMDFLYSDSPARESEAGRRDTESLRKRKYDGEEVEETHQKRKTSRKRKAGGGAEPSAEGEATDRSSGVLTPPSSGAEDGGRGAAGGGEGAEGDSSLVSLEEDRREKGNGDEGNEAEEEGDFTYPDAAATGIHFDDDEGDEGRMVANKAFPGRRRGRPNAARQQPLPSHSNNTTTVDDTGVYWQNPNLLHPRQATHGQTQESEQDSSSLLGAGEKPAKKFPGRRRPRPRDGMMVKKAMDLSELLGMGGGKGEESPLNKEPKAQGGEESVDDSYESKASDQRQLLGEMSARRVKVGGGSGLREVVSHGQESSKDLTPEEEEVDEDAADDRFAGEESTFRSYEEFLNRDSPTKVQVKFGDSLNSSLLAPRKEYSSLFAQGAAQRPTQPTSQPLSVGLSTERQEPQSITQPMRKQQEGPSPSLANPSQGILDRLTTNFWSALIRPTGPTEVLPETSRPPSTFTTTAPNHFPPQNIKQPPPPPSQPPPSYPTTLRTRLRSRYGVLSASHPWTLAHMRTLHRMLNSATSGKSDSVIPTPSSTIHNQTVHAHSTLSTSSSASTSAVSLPPHLCSRISSVQTSYSGNHRFVFTEIHAQVVEAFMAILVPGEIVAAIEKGEIDGLGDSTARKLRGWYGGRWGGDVRVWEEGTGERAQKGWFGWGGWSVGGDGDVRSVKAGERIGEGFVVAALGDCVGWNERGR